MLLAVVWAGRSEREIYYCIWCVTEVTDGSSASVGCAEICGWCASFSTGAGVCLRGVSPALFVGTVLPFVRSG